MSPRPVSHTSLRRVGNQNIIYSLCSVILVTCRNACLPSISPPAVHLARSLTFRRARSTLSRQKTRSDDRATSLKAARAGLWTRSRQVRFSGTGAVAHAAGVPKLCMAARSSAAIDHAGCCGIRYDCRGVLVSRIEPRRALDVTCSSPARR